MSNNVILDRLDDVRRLLDVSRRELEAQTVKGNKSAGVRARKSLRTAKAALHEIVRESNLWGSNEDSSET